MFFIVTHRWKKQDEAEALETLARMLQNAKDGKFLTFGTAWPQLFSLWSAPGHSMAYSIWESSRPDMIEPIFAALEKITTEKVFVHQIAPPNMNLYSYVHLETKQDPVQ